MLSHWGACDGLVRVPGESGDYVGNSVAKYICVKYSSVIILELVLNISTLINDLQKPRKNFRNFISVRHEETKNPNLKKYKICINGNRNSIVINGN